MSQLERYTTGEVTPHRADRAVAAQAKALYDQVRIAAFKVDGAFALADHIMQKAVVLDEHRRALAGDDPITNQMLAEIEVAAVRQATNIQRKLFDAWGL